MFRHSLSHLAALALAALAVFPALGQDNSGALSGVIYDSTGSAVRGALVEVEMQDQTKSAQSDAVGRFRFSGLAAGEHELAVTKEGFERIVRSVRVSADRPTSIEIQLAVVGVRSEVTVRAQRPASLYEQSLEMYEASKTTTSLGGETLVNNNPVNNYDALRLLPGVSSAAFGGRDRFSTPTSIRGNGAWGTVETIDEYPAVQITPVSAEDGGYTAGFSSIIPAVAVQEVTLATGGLGVVYGQASGGVVKNRIKTGNPSAPHATLRAEGVGIGEFIAMGDVSGGVDRLDYYVSAQAVGGDYGDAYNTFPRPIQNLRGVSGLAKVGLRASKKGRLEGMFVGGDERHAFFQSSTASDGGAVRHDYDTFKENYFWAGRYDHRFRDDLAFSGGVTHSRFHENRVEQFANGTPVGVSRRNRPQRASSGFADLTWQTQLGDGWRYSGSAGGEVRRDRFADITNQPVEFDFGEDALYFRNSIAVSGLTINAGIRNTWIDNSFQTNDRQAWDVGAAYRLPTRTSLKASYSTGYRLNKPFYLWWGGGQNIFREPANGLRPSTTETTELGLEQAFLIGGNVSGTARVSFFRTDESDLFNFANTGTGTPYYDQLRVDGFELWSEWKIGKVQPFVSYTWLENVRTGSDNLNASNLDLRFSPLPTDSGSFGARLPLLRRFQVSAFAIYDNGGLQQQLVNDQIVVTRFSKFVRVNAIASVNLTEKWSLLLRAENLLNRRDQGYTRSTFQMDGSAELTDGQQRDPGIVLAVGAQWQF